MAQKTIQIADKPTLDAIKTRVDALAASGGNSYPNISSGRIESGKNITITGRGKITLSVVDEKGRFYIDNIDGTSISGFCINSIYGSGSITISFEKNINVSWSCNDSRYSGYYLAQLSN